MKDFLQQMYVDAEHLNTENVKDALNSTGPHKNLLDVGCWDGENTKIWAKAAGATNVFGIEPTKQKERSNIKVYSIKADSDRWPIPSATIDCVISNQVVEHLSDLDHFFSQASRVLKVGGTIITSTNNLSSLHNIFALIMGWAPFDLTNSSYKDWGIGNPLATHRGESDKRGKTWTHKTIYTAKWLFEWQEIYHLNKVSLYGSGLYPFPSVFGKIFPKYSAFITTVCKKTK
jgi:SAM-dependent methyltransferase